MSNRVTIQRTKFTNYDTDEKSFGYRLYDDYGQSYSNIMDERELKSSDEDFFNLVCDSADEVGDAMISHALEHGIYIDSNWYEANQLTDWRN
jgi:hypothetical protein